MKAIDVLKAAKNTFQKYGDEDYATRKSNSFLNRCGVKLEDGPNQEIAMETIKQIVYAMLDSESEKVFWAHLKTVN